MINKPSIIITSLGRTGTKFFATLFSDIIPDATSLHEPDLFHFNLKQKKGVKFVFYQIEKSGFYNLILKKILGDWSLIKLSDDRIKGLLNNSNVKSKIYKQRKKFIDNKAVNIYIESNLGYYGLIDLLPKVFDQHNILFVIRDGRFWVDSWMNWGFSIYNKSNIRKAIGHNWPMACEFETDPYKNVWNHMSNFEKLCWAWSKLNTFALDCLKQNPNAQLVRFEDIFEADNRYDNLKVAVDFATQFNDGTKLEYKPLDGWLENKVHTSGKKSSSDNWTKQQNETFQRMCGPLMEKLGYEMD
ncbi:MAG: hypothetical protein ACQESQ_09600 [Bacteroidota bacterium]